MSSGSIISLNGVITPAEEARIPIMDRGFLFGDGIYETGRTYSSCFLFLEEHLRRLRTSAERLHIPLPWDDKYLVDQLIRTARAQELPDVYFRIIVTRGVVDYLGLDVGLSAFEPSLQPSLVIVIQPLHLPDYEKGMTLITSQVQRNSPKAQDPSIKTCNYLNSLLALWDAKKAKADDAIMLDANGWVAEGTTFSLFGVDANQTLLTPSLDIGILDSIMRRHVLELAHRHGLSTQEGKWSHIEFKKCREIFIASSVREVLGISKWDDTTYPCPGPLTLEMDNWLHETIVSYYSNPAHVRFREA